MDRPKVGAALARVGAQGRGGAQRQVDSDSLHGLVRAACSCAVTRQGRRRVGCMTCWRWTLLLERIEARQLAWGCAR